MSAATISNITFNDFIFLYSMIFLTFFVGKLHLMWTVFTIRLVLFINQDTIKNCVN